MTYDFYPFTSEDVVWKEGNKCVLDEDETYSGFVCIEKNMIEEEIRSITEASKIVINGHLAKVGTVVPLLENRELLVMIKDSKKKRLDNARELSNGDPVVWADSRAEIELKYQKDLNDVGYTHLTYGFTYPGYPSTETVVDALKGLEKFILEY